MNNTIQFVREATEINRRTIESHKDNIRTLVEKVICDTSIPWEERGQVFTENSDYLKYHHFIPDWFHDFNNEYNFTYYIDRNQDVYTYECIIHMRESGLVNVSLIERMFAEGIGKFSYDW